MGEKGVVRWRMELEQTGPQGGKRTRLNQVQLKWGGMNKENIIFTTN